MIRTLIYFEIILTDFFWKIIYSLKLKYMFVMRPILKTFSEFFDRLRYVYLNYRGASCFQP